MVDSSASGSNGTRSVVISPASSVETSRMSFSTSSRWSALRWMVSAWRRCTGSSRLSSSSPVMPITPFIGVRISWLIEARNSSLARAPAAAARPLSRSAWLCACSARDWRSSSQSAASTITAVPDIDTASNSASRCDPAQAAARLRVTSTSISPCAAVAKAASTSCPAASGPAKLPRSRMGRSRNGQAEGCN